LTQSCGLILGSKLYSKEDTVARASELKLVISLLILVGAHRTCGQTFESICNLQQQVAQGAHRSVRVFGIYSSGVDMGVLEHADCPGQGTWVELALQSSQNKKRLKKIMDTSGKVKVVFEGEFYGPPEPDPKLPESIRKAHHGGWGHLGSFKTKLVVSKIVEATQISDQ
jgi:hypothetical protein